MNEWMLLLPRWLIRNDDGDVLTPAACGMSKLVGTKYKGG